MKKILLLAVLFSIQIIGFKALATNNHLLCVPTISTGTISPSTICAGTVISVPFTLTDCVDPTNVFTVQLSNASGSFASPINIGSSTGTTSGFIISIIPPSTTFGSGYRIRVVSSSPVAIGTDNGVDIVLLPKPSASYTINNSSQCFNGNSFNFTNTSTGSISSYQWNLGDGVATNNTNISNYSYVAQGSYNVTLTTTGTNGCKDSSTKTVTVTPKPVPNFIFSNSNPCSGTSFNFTNTSTIASGTETFSWSFGDGNTSTAINPNNTFPAAGAYIVKLIATSNNGCSDSISKTINVLDKPVASFLVNTATQCLTGNSFSFPNFSTGVGNTYSWNFGDGVTSTTTNGSHTYFAAGIFTVKLIATNVNGCKDSSTQTVTVLSAPAVSFSTVGSTLCSNNFSIQFNNTTTGSGNTYSWDFGDGSTSTATSPNKTYSSPGTYPVKLVVTNASGCKDSVTQNVLVDTKPTANYSINTTTQCINNNLFVFNNTSSGFVTTVFWDFGDGITSSLVSPSKAYSTAGTYNVKLIVTNANGCKDSISQTINVIDKPVPAFSINGNTGCSSNLNVSFTNTSTGVSNTYLWSFGDGNTSIATNPSNTYAAVGFYIVRLVATNFAGCKDSTEHSITFATKPTAAFSVNVNNQCINSNTFTFTNNSVGGVGYFWDFGDGITSTVANPTKSYVSTGVYTVKLVVTNGSGCKDSTTQIVTVLAKPVAAFTVTGNTGCTTNLTVGTINTSTGTGLSYTWDFGDGTTSTATNPNKTYAVAGLYNIKLVVTGVNGCKDSITQSVTFSPVTTASFTTNTNSQCINGGNFTFTNTTIGSNTYLWNFGDGITSTVTNPTKTFTNAGSYTVKLFVTNASGCVDSASQTISVLAAPVAGFTTSGSTNCTNNLTITATNTSTGTGLTYAWSFGDGTTSTATNPAKTYATAGLYTVKLIVTNSNGCKDSTIKTITFTPKPTAGYTFIGTGFTQCFNGNNYTFIDASANATSYFWDFGNGTTSTLANPPTYTYTSAGTYVVKHIVTNGSGCSDTLSNSVTVLPSPNAVFTVNYQACSQTVNFAQVNTANTVFSAWDYGNGAGASDVFTTSNTYSSNGTYFVKYYAYTAGFACVDSFTQTITLTAKPVAQISILSPSTQCYNKGQNNFSVNSNNSFNAASYLWSFGDGSTSTLATPPAHTYATTGNFIITLVVANAQGCKDTTTTVVTVNKNPVGSIRITSGATGCTNNLTIGLDDSLSNNNQKSYFSWSFGDGGTSSQPNPLKTYSTQGTYTITLITGGTGVSGTSGCIDTTTRVVSFFKLPTLGIFQNAPNTTTQCLTGNIYNLADATAQAASWSWNFGDGTIINGISASHSYANAGNYTITETATSNQGCTNTTTLNVTVLPSPKAAFTVNYQACGSLNAQFSQTNTTNTVFSAWYFGDGNGPNDVFNTSHTYATTGSYTVKYYAYDATFTCSDSATQIITFNPKPAVSPIAIKPTTQCSKNNSFAFSDGLATATSYSWNFGDGATATGIGVSHSYTFSGTYTVTEIATSNQGCKDSATITVIVRQSPDAAFNVTYQPCNNLTAQFNLAHVGTTPSTFWSFGDGATANAGISTSHTYPTTGTYTVTNIGYNLGATCSDTSTQTITFYPKPQLGITVVSTSTQCLKTNSFAFGDAFLTAASYSWNFGDGATATGSTVSHTYTTAGTFTVKEFATSANGCTDSATTNITVLPSPDATFIATYQSCNNLTAQFAQTNTANTGFSAWSFGDGATSTTLFNVSHTYSSTGTYVVKYTVYDASLACVDSSTQTLAFNPHTTAAFTLNGNATQCLIGNAYNFVNTSSGATSYLWNFGDGSTSTLATPATHTYAVAGSYIVKLIATNTNGCIDSLSLPVTVVADALPSFTYTGATGCTNNLTLVFNNTSTGAISYAWDFGDATTSIATNPTHTYATTGTYIVKLVTTNANGCKDSTSQTVVFAISPTAAFTVNNSVQCLNGNSFTFTNSSINYVASSWNFGDGTTSTLNNPTHIYTTAGVYTVKLIVTNVAGCKDSTTTSITVNAKPTAAFTHTGATGCTSNLTVAFANTSTGSNLSYAWSFGDGVTSTATSPTHTYATTGVYIVKLIATNANGCIDSTTQTITFNILPTAAFSVNNSTQCISIDSFVLTNNSINYSISSWNFGDGGTSTLNNPTHIYTTPGTYIIKLIVTNANGCKDSTTTLITVNAKPTAAFTYTGTTGCTSNLSLAFANNTTGAGLVYAWDFGDGTTSTVTNPTHTYAATGTYIIKLVATNANGCKDSTTQIITFTSKPVVDYNLNATNGCTNTTFSFTDASTNLSSSPAYFWDFGDASVSILQNPTHTYATAGTYKVYLYVTNANSCKDSISKTITVVAKPTAAFTIPTYSSCSNNNSFSFTNTSTNAVTYVWDFGDGTTSILTNPTKVYATQGTYIVKLIAINSSGCKDSTSQTITFSAKPVAAYTASALNGCTNTVISFNDASTNLSTPAYYFWDFGDATVSILQNPTHTYTTAGTYKVLFYVTNVSGCKDSISKTITVVAKPTAAFTIPNYSSCSNTNSFSFTNTSTGATSYAWDFGDGTTSILQNPAKVYATQGTYIVKLVVTNASGCKDSASQTISLIPKPVAVYNVNGTSQCVGNSFAFTDASTSLTTPSYYFWDFGDGTTSLLQNPVKAYSAAGTYKVLLYVTNANGCKDSVSKTVSLLVKPTASFTTPFNSGCSVNNTLAFTNTSTNAATYFWDFGDGTTSILASPTKTYAVQGTYTVKLVATNANGCKDSSTQTITLMSKPTAAFTSNGTTLCSGSNFVFTNTSSNLQAPSYYYWDFGDGTFSLQQNVTKAYTAGTYKVLLYVTNANGCKDSISKTVTITAKPTASFSIPNYSSCSNGNTFAFTNSSTGAVSYTWDFGDATGSTLQTPTKAYTTTGTYTITLVATNASGCSDTSRQTITLLPKPTAAYNTSSVGGCLNSVFNFTDASTGLSATSYYYWDFGDGTFSYLQNPTKVFSTTGTFKILFYVTNLNGCKDSISKMITIVSKPTASFTTPFGNGCSNNNTITLVNNSTGAVSYAWDFGDGTGSTLQSPTKVYATQGTYIIKLVVTNAGGCKDSVSQTISLLPKPVAAYNVSSTNACTNAAFSFTDASTSLSTPSYYYWDFGDGTFSLLQNPYKVFTTTGTFKVLLYVTNANGCKDSISKMITVASKPTASFTTPNANGCTTNNTFTFVNSSSNATSFVWDFGDGSGSYLQNPTKVYAAQGTYIVTLIAMNANGCSDTSKQTITLLSKPTAAFTVSSTSQCLASNSFSFANSSTGSITSFVWDFGDGTTSTILNPTKTYNAIGTYTVKLTVTNTNNCTSVATQIITVVGKPSVSFNINNATQCLYGNVFTFTNTSSNQAGVSYFWNFGDGILSTQNPISKSYAFVGTYSVTLIATNGNGCVDSIVKTVTVVGKPTPSFTASGNNQCVNNVIAFTNTTAATGANFIWKFGDGSSTNTTSPVHSYANSGVYTVTLVASISGGCVDSISQSIFVVAKPVASFTAQASNQCSGSNTINFTNTSTGNISSYLWYFSDGTVSTDFNPVKTFATAGTYSAKLLIVSNSGCRDSVTQSFTVLQKTAASFSLNSLIQCINNNSFTFTSTSTTGLNSLTYQWDLGDGTLASTSTVTKSYLLPGTYNVKLVVVNATTGCRDSVYATVSVRPQPTAGFSGSGTICSGNSFVINTTFSGTPPFSFTYNDGTSNHFVSGINTYLYGLGVSPTATTTYTMVAMNDAYCSASTAVIASVKSTVVVNNVLFTQQPTSLTVACVGNTVTLTGIATSNSTFTYQWQKNGVNILGATSNTLTLANIGVLDSGTYRLAAILPCGNIYSNNAVVSVPAAAAPPAFTPIVTLCQYDSAKALTASGTLLNWYVTATGGIASQVPPIPNTLVIGTQQYWVSNSTVNNCESQRYLITVNVLPAPTIAVAVYGSTVLLPSQTVTLAAAATNALGIRWYYNGKNIGSTPNNELIVGFNNLGTYQAESVTAQGCTARSQIINVTAPNGYAASSEGSNLRLYPNPATKFVNMYFDNPINQNATVRLVNMSGQILQTKPVLYTQKFQQIQMNVANLQAGTYAIEVLSSKGFTIARNLFVKVY